MKDVSTTWPTTWALQGDDLHACILSDLQWKTHCGILLGGYETAAELMTVARKADITCTTCAAALMHIVFIKDKT